MLVIQASRRTASKARRQLPAPLFGIGASVVVVGGGGNHCSADRSRTSRIQEKRKDERLGASMARDSRHWRRSGNDGATWHDWQHAEASRYAAPSSYYADQGRWQPQQAPRAHEYNDDYYAQQRLDQWRDHTRAYGQATEHHDAARQHLDWRQEANDRDQRAWASWAHPHSYQVYAPGPFASGQVRDAHWSASGKRGKKGSDQRRKGQSQSRATLDLEHEHRTRFETRLPSNEGEAVRNGDDTSRQGRMHNRDSTSYRLASTSGMAAVTKPRTHYLEQSASPPHNYPLTTKLPGPLPLLVLDLNGTLVFRNKQLGTSRNRSAKPVLRPYLKCFLQYCLGIDGSAAQDEESSMSWSQWDESSDAGEARGVRDRHDRDTLHGSHFWKYRNEEPLPHPDAAFRVLVWSSAQPRNVDLMVRAIFSPAQAQHLLRVYARDTLVIKRYYLQKSPSVKDLEILWAALNSSLADATGAKKGETGATEVEDQDMFSSRGERRIFADVRHHEGRGMTNHARRTEFESQLRSLWHDKVIVPELVVDNYRDGQGYGPHNTLLLDDSVDKAMLQPYNHALVAEFDEDRADLAKEAQESAASTDVFSRECDDILLQFVGVLEHARHQVNISSWIRMGGLGNFSAMASQHPYYLDEELVGVASEADADKIAAQASAYFSEEASDESYSEPQLRAKVEARSPHFWASEGRSALLRRGIKPCMFS